MSARKRPGRARPGEDGFTLIEVLVSLVLLALVLGLLSGVMRFARGTWDAAARLDREAGYDTAANFLRARLGEALPIFERADTGAMRVTFSGTAQTLKFVAASQNGPAGAGLYALALEAAQAGGASQALLARVAPYQQAKTGPETPPEDHVLAENIKSVAFRYFGRKDRRQPPAWQDAWARTDALPDLVEMTVDYADRRGSSVVLIELRLRNRT